MSLRQRIVIAVLLAAAVVGIVAGFQMHKETSDPVRPRDVLAVFPKQGDTILRQDTIYAEVGFPFTGTLVIDDLEIPDPQLVRIQTGNRTRIAYTPGPTTVTGYLRAGLHKAELKYWLPERPNEVSAYSWSFTVK